MCVDRFHIASLFLSNPCTPSTLSKEVFVYFVCPTEIPQPPCAWKYYVVNSVWSQNTLGKHSMTWRLLANCHSLCLHTASCIYQYWHVWRAGSVPQSSSARIHLLLHIFKVYATGTRRYECDNCGGHRDSRAITVRIMMALAIVSCPGHSDSQAITV